MKNELIIFTTNLSFLSVEYPFDSLFMVNFHHKIYLNGTGLASKTYISKKARGQAKS